jgi:hypothetical protein
MIKIECEERDIEDFLCADINKHLGLRLIGRQINTPAGIIDILAYSKDQGVYFVVELKKNYLNAIAFVQVIRYSNYLNCNFSKGKRVFIPMLIGMDLHDELEKSVFLYEEDNVVKTDFWKVYYTLFNFSADHGITFAWHKGNQRQYETDNLLPDDYQNYIDGMHYIEKMIDELVDKEHEVNILKRFIEENGVCSD